MNKVYATPHFPAGVICGGDHLNITMPYRSGFCQTLRFFSYFSADNRLVSHVLLLLEDVCPGWGFTLLFSMDLRYQCCRFLLLVGLQTYRTILFFYKDMYS